MKKTLVVLSMLLLVVLTSRFVYARNLEPETQESQKINVEDREAWFKERMEWKKTQINGTLNEGLITKEEAKTWNDHFAYMEKFHKENGFMPGCNGMGNYNNQSRYRDRFGGRMMRKNRWNR